MTAGRPQPDIRTLGRISERRIYDPIGLKLAGTFSDPANVAQKSTRFVGLSSVSQIGSPCLRSFQEKRGSRRLGSW
jgi:hypothetical protein